MTVVWVHRLAVATAAVTVFLLFVGAVVTSKGVGLAVPDWPTTFGYNMFLFPWARMVGGVFYEHSHRLVASGVGLLTIFLAVFLWMKDARPWVVWLGVLALVLVIVQGVVGGLRVVFIEQWFAVVHAALAQAFFGLIVALALFTSKLWREPATSLQTAEAARIQRLCVLTAVLVYLQAILGALLRHTGAALELHVLVALIVAVHVFLIARRVCALDDPGGVLKKPAVWLVGVLAVQLLLGLGSYMARFSAFAPQWSSHWMVALTAAHVVTGALMLALSVVLALLAFRLLEPETRTITSVAMTQRVSA